MTMKEPTCVLNVLMFLFHHHINDDCNIDECNRPEVTSQLAEAGFAPEAINGAFQWLWCLKNSYSSFKEMPTASNHATRVFGDHEQALIDLECREYLHLLEKLNILDTKTRETVIDLAIVLKDDGLDIGLIKWVTLMTLYNNKECADQLSRMELLVLSDTDTTLQ
jgi:Smg protein